MMRVSHPHRPRRSGGALRRALLLLVLGGSCLWAQPVEGATAARLRDLEAQRKHYRELVTALEQGRPAEARAALGSLWQLEHLVRFPNGAATRSPRRWLKEQALGFLKETAEKAASRKKKAQGQPLGRPCGRCGGTGMITCRRCKGSGVWRDPSRGRRKEPCAVLEPCPRCLRVGRIGGPDGAAAACRDVSERAERLAQDPRTRPGQVLGEMQGVTPALAPFGPVLDYAAGAELRALLPRVPVTSRNLDTRQRAAFERAWRGASVRQRHDFARGLAFEASAALEILSRAERVGGALGDLESLDVVQPVELLLDPRLLDRPLLVRLELKEGTAVAPAGWPLRGPLRALAGEESPFLLLHAASEEDRELYEAAQRLTRSNALRAWVRAYPRQGALERLAAARGTVTVLAVLREHPRLSPPLALEMLALEEDVR
jgi:hypothetical protein